MSNWVKMGRQTARHLDRQTSRAGLPGPFSSSASGKLLSAWIRLAYSSWASAASRARPLFTMETCPALALWLAHAITRQTLCLTIQIIMALQQDDSRRRVMQKGLFSYRFCPLEMLHSAGAREAQTPACSPHDIQLVTCAAPNQIHKTVPTKSLKF